MILLGILQLLLAVAFSVALYLWNKYEAREEELSVAVWTNFVFIVSIAAFTLGGLQLTFGRIA